ncbi:MAG: hypothetical protein KDN22_06290 [Verrucomicrobiae bacterium]|nr:hypothetical protein [Verrucomicrobiae bacterium]
MISFASSASASSTYTLTPDFVAKEYGMRLAEIESGIYASMFRDAKSKRIRSASIKSKQFAIVVIVGL